MYAIIETGGKQYWVAPGETIQVDRLEAKEGDEISFKALWCAKQTSTDAPANGKAEVKAEIIRHLRGPKIIVFKKKTKKAYEKASGQRRDLTEIKVKTIA